MFRNQVFISDYYRGLFENIKKQILSEEDEYIIQSNLDELVDYYFSNNCLSPIEFDKERQENFEHRKELRTVRAHEREEFYRSEGDLDFEYESIIVNIPIIPNNNLQTILSLQSSTFSLSGDSKVNLGYNTISFSIDIKGYGFNYDDDKVASLVQQKKNEIISWINRKNADIIKENEQLKSNIKSFIENRKQKLTADKERVNTLIQKINIPLKQKEDEAVKRIRLDPKPLVKKIKPTSLQQQEEYVLDRNKVLDIISVIDNQGKQFEKTPKTYRDFKEENFRDVILVNLNSIFEGKATGETFSNKGKTDIYLNIEKGNILICECKIWGGKQLYDNTIYQLLDYLTWRNNFGIIIIFVKQKNFSKILESMKDIICQHPSYMTGFKQISETHFLSHHKLRQDEFKSVEIHHLFYNLYQE